MPELLTIYDNGDCDEERLIVPAKFEVCGQCQGNGTHVNPSIDGHGLTREDFDADPDFEEQYFSGVFDVRCYECKGERVVKVPNWDAMTEEQRERVEDHWRCMEEHYAEMEAERRMGA